LSQGLKRFAKFAIFRRFRATVTNQKVSLSYEDVTSGKLNSNLGLIFLILTCCSCVEIENHQ
jgi:hypothetical protein